MKTLQLTSTKRNEFIDITAKIESAIEIDQGIVTVFIPHTTAGITINESADPDVRRDLLYKLENLIPETDNYHHAEGNSDAHLKASLVGSSVQVIVENGELQLGTWQGVYFCEFDGPGKRTVRVKTS